MITIKNKQNEMVLVSSKTLTMKFGRSTAQFIQQLHYWIEKKEGVLKENTRWIYNTAKEWASQLCLSSRQIERIIQKLKDLNIIFVDHFSKTNRVNFLTINYEALNVCFNEEKQHDKTSVSDRQNVGIHIKNTKITNKEKNNKSEEGQGSQTNKNNLCLVHTKQVEQVKNFNQKKDDLMCVSATTQISEEKQQDVSAALTLSSTIQKPTTVQDMLAFWNQSFVGSETKATKELSRLLMAAFKHKFDSDMNKWKHFCKRIESSSYLMGQGFNLSLFWVLKFSTIDRLLNGDFGVKDIQEEICQETLVEKALLQIADLKESDVCKDVRQKILTVIGAASYLSWFTKVCFVENNHGLQMKAENAFVQDYITTHYGYLFM